MKLSPDIARLMRVPERKATKPSARFLCPIRGRGEKQLSREQREHLLGGDTWLSADERDAERIAAHNLRRARERELLREANALLEAAGFNVRKGW